MPVALLFWPSEFQPLILIYSEEILRRLNKFISESENEYLADQGRRDSGEHQCKKRAIDFGSGNKSRNPTWSGRIVPLRNKLPESADGYINMILPQKSFL